MQYKTKQNEMKCNAMKTITINQGSDMGKIRPIGISGGRD